MRAYDPALEMMRRRRTRDTFISSSIETTADTSDLVRALQTVTELARLQSENIAKLSERVSELERFVGSVSMLKLAS